MKKIILSLIFALMILSASLLFLMAEHIIDPTDQYESEGMRAVFVSDNGSDENDGSNAASAFKTLDAAYKSLSETGGIVVVCGKLSLSGNNTTLPQNEKPIEFTSYYDGVDYRAKKGAEFYFEENLHINGKALTYFYGVKFHSEKKANIFCNGSDVRFGSRIESISDNDGYPSIYGGTYLTDSSNVDDGNFSSFSLTVEAGYWHHITLGNLRSTENSPFCTISDATLSITGGTYTANDSQNDLTSAVSGAKASGKITFNISGGIFYGSVYAIGFEGDILPGHDLSYHSDVNFYIENGSFLGKYIKALYSKGARLIGDYHFKADRGSFSSLVYVGCEGVEGEITLDSCESVQNKLYGFEKVVYVSSSGDDEKSGENPQSAKKTLSGAFAALRSGGTIVICSSIELPNGFTTRTSNQKIRITSSYYDEHYASSKNAKLIVDGNISLRSDIIFENIEIQAKDPATFVCHSQNTKFGSGVSIEGDVAIHLAKNQNSHTIEIASGSYSFVSFDSSDISTFISVTGGTIDLFRGCTEMHQGDIFVDLSGGTINNDLNIAPKGIVGNLQLIVGNAHIKGTISTLRPDTDKRCEALVVYNYDKSKLSGFDLIDDNYVFVKDGADGNGSTPSNASGDLLSAYKYLGNTNATVVICGKYTHKSEYTPSNIGTLTYTSVYRNIDFSKINNAKIRLFSDFNFDSDATMENITIEMMEKGLCFNLNSHIVILGEAIRCESPIPHKSYFPSIYANTSIPSSPYDENGLSVSDKVIIRGGVWNDVFGSASVEISGGVIRGSVFGCRDLSVNSCIEISGGVIFGGVYASVSPVENAQSHIVMSLTGGKISGVISPSLNPSVGYTGKFLINVTYADLSEVEKIYDASFIGGDRSYANVLDEIDMTIVSNGYSSYQNPLTDRVSTLSYYSGYYYLSQFDGDVLNVYKSKSLKSITSCLPSYSVKTDGMPLSLSGSISSGRLYLFTNLYVDSKTQTYVYTVNLDAEGDTLNLIPDNYEKPLGSPSLFKLEGKIYLLYSQFDTDTENIYCVEVDTALNQRSEPVLIISPQDKWENGRITTPRIVRSNNALYLLYTGGGLYGGSSMIGLAKITSLDLLNPSSFEKQHDPIFYENSQYQNIVLQDIISIEESKEPYFTFSSRYRGFYTVILQSFSYDTEGVPYLNSPADITMEYLHYRIGNSLDELLAAFKINVSDEIPTDPIIPQGATFFDILQNNSILLVSSAFVIIFIFILVLIKKYSQNPKTQFKKNQKQRSKNERKRASRLKAGRVYAANLERSESLKDKIDDGAVDSISLDEPAELPPDIEELPDIKSTHDSVSVDRMSNSVDLSEMQEEADSNTEISEIVSTSSGNESDTSLAQKEDDNNNNQSPRRRPRPTRRI